MEETQSRTRIAPPVLWLFIITIVCAVATILTVTLLNRARPDIRSQFRLYVEKLAPQSKLVVASATQQYRASKEFTSRLLALFDIRASIKLSAMAEVTYVLPADRAEGWDVAWYPKERRLVVT
ncbi:MAG: hypothetical protein N3A02_05430, partial [Rectinema sp.]|nr:hypothetical protein [Rectinema sp.]